MKGPSFNKVRRYVPFRTSACIPYVRYQKK